MAAVQDHQVPVEHISDHDLHYYLGMVPRDSVQKPANPGAPAVVPGMHRAGRGERRPRGREPRGDRPRGVNGILAVDQGWSELSGPGANRASIPRDAKS